ncbi:MAG TPA: prolyl oligopeptidase family serine peptidase, partial [Stellaceae bacterium]|nr:prolyl oligopeptidase family serine peptidase [Stellaceae bacterium]
LLVHGDADQVVEPSAHPEALAALQAAGVTVQGLLRPGLGHGIDAEGLARGGEFLKAALGV